MELRVGGRRVSLVLFLKLFLPFLGPPDFLDFGG